MNSTTSNLSFEPGMRPPAFTRISKSLVALCILTPLVGSALAGEGEIWPVKIERLSIVGPATGGHIAGNMEIKVLGGFTPPAGVNCSDTSHLTTRKTTDPDRAMFTVLLKAQTTPQSIKLRITDSPTLAAYSGRCSIEFVEVY